MWWKAATFIAMSGIIAAVSWRSLRVPRSHGFPRFFAWAAILVLVLLNIEDWFTEPFSPRQILSWLLLLSSIPVVLSGVLLLRKVGGAVERGTGRAGDSSNLAFENTANLVETGIYRYIRHPLYSSLLLLTWGVFLKDPSIAGFTVALVATGCLTVTAIFEERENLAAFGPAYAGYMSRTRRFLPIPRRVGD